MINYLIEMDLIPCEYNRLQYPVTRRHLVVASNISEALLFADKEYAPGRDCIAIRVLEIGEKE